ncbi:MAG: site-specific DNA-methyltransferase [Christensenellaceae bacterium]|jgi:adenine-specific DNA-methyltransferase|nr:site-specific DNA-methyltransferase [Christensenellaceae bacterium]
MSKLELTWVGKDKQINPEPRILIKKEDLCYGQKGTGNILIHGDNLLALKSLEQDFAGKIKCIYIDPPFNTGSAQNIHYDDNLEHSIWLNLMKPRLEILRNLLSNDGSIYVHIDNAEQAYLKVLMDEIFMRRNFVQMISIKRASPAGFKVVNPGPLTVTDYILLYAKNKEHLFYNPQRIPVAYDSNYDSYISNFSESPENWKIAKLVDLIYKEWGVSNWTEAKKKFGDSWKALRDCALAEKAIEMRECVVSVRDPHKPSELIRKTMQQSKIDREKVFLIKRAEREPIYIFNGGSLSFYKNKLREIDGTLTPTELLTDFWSDMNFAGIANEGAVQFKNSKKPEMLVRRIIELASNPGDIVLDSFLGSGTTAAVAHKMGRRWIGIELGEHAYTHCKVRLDKVIDGEQGGISKSIGWQGGGGYEFYELAPSLINVDKIGMPIISKEYNAEMLAVAMAKHENYSYCPDENISWKQGYIGESKDTAKNFIFTTTGTITAEYLDGISIELGEDEFLLICASCFTPNCKNRHKNITLQKIPQILLGRCEYGKTDYNLNVAEQITDFDDEGEYK